jgi:hypothetical protein
MRTPILDLGFPHDWQAEILSRPPLIAPSRQYVYPRVVEEVELGALQILLRAAPDAAPALMTFALGFAAPTLPHGLWSCPNPAQLCAIAGGYAFLVESSDPQHWEQVPYRPVTAVHPAMDAGLIIFAGFHQLWALGREGKAWETGKLSWEGVRVTHIAKDRLTGFGWDLQTDREVEFTVDLRTGSHTGGAKSLTGE